MKELHGADSPDLHSFRTLKATLPATKIGAVIALLPEIQQLQRQGHKTRAIWQSLQNDDLYMSYDLFRLYLGRARRRLRMLVSAPPTAPQSAGESEVRTARGSMATILRTDKAAHQDQLRAANTHSDPFATARTVRKQKAQERFEYDPLTPLKEDLLR